MEQTPEGNRPDALTPLSRRLAELKVHALPGALSALDADQRRRESGPPLDASELRRMLEELRGAEGIDDALRLREAWVEELLGAVQMKLAQRGQPELLAQGLRRLEELLYAQPAPSDPRLAEVDGALTALQQAARKRLLTEVGLQRLADQTGLPLDAGRHEVVSSEVGDDPVRDETVKRQEAAGWLLGDAVLIPARVVRYAATSARRAAPPADAGRWGEKSGNTSQ